MDKSKLVPPQKDGRDIVHAAVAGTTGLIPVAGAAANELYKAIILPAFDKRNQEWQEAVSEALNELLDREIVDYEKLSTDEEFITILIKANFIAWQDQRKEKREALRNAALNSAKGIDIDPDFQQQFLRWIDELTVSHIQILQYLYRNMDKFLQVNSFEGIRIKFQKDTGSGIKANEITLLIQDLDRRDLIEISSEIDDQRVVRKKVPENTGRVITREIQERPKMKTTRIGLDFLRFIKNPLDAE
ncbi:hypothetical protein KQI63_06520 [bacterium]|nr:hypothetical protein [bacterium]